MAIKHNKLLPRLEPFGQRFSLDARSLGVFRIGLGTLLLVDLCWRSRDLEAHYTDNGVLPLAVLGRLYSSPWTWSLHRLSGEAAWIWALFAVAAVAAVALMLGWRTRLATVISWVLCVSLINRNPLLEHGGDTLLRLLLFWAMFLPLGRRFSLDARQSPPLADKVSGVAAAALLLQIVCVYWCTFVLKSGPQWRQEGSAAYDILAASQFTRPLGQQLALYLRNHPGTVPALTHLSLATELLAPFLLLWAGRGGNLTRLAGVGMLAALHLSLQCLLNLGLFPFVDLVALAALLPAACWPRRWSSLEVSELSGKTAKVAWRARVARTLAAAALAEVLLINLSAMPVIGFSLPAPLTAAGRAFRLDQYWTMFAPSPVNFGGWIVSVGHLQDGRQIDLFNNPGGPVSWERPASVADTYRNDRWRLLLVHMVGKQYESYRTLFADYLCRSWPQAYPSEPLASVELIDMREATSLTRPILVKPELLLHYSCPSRGETLLTQTKEFL